MWSNADASNVDSAIGVKSSNICFSVNNTSSTGGFNWYGGTTRLARLNSSGTFDPKTVSASGKPLLPVGILTKLKLFYIGTGGDFGNGRVNITAAASTKLCYFGTANAGQQVGSISTGGLTVTYKHSVGLPT